MTSTSTRRRWVTKVSPPLATKLPWDMTRAELDAQRAEPLSHAVVEMFADRLINQAKKRERRERKVVATKLRRAEKKGDKIAVEMIYRVRLEHPTWTDEQILQHLALGKAQRKPLQRAVKKAQIIRRRIGAPIILMPRADFTGIPTRKPVA